MMERFRPDSWLEGFLRPLLLADPTTLLYVEMLAPDLRFAILAVLGIVAVLVMRRTTAFTSVQSRVVVGFVITFYIWTFVSGNGRYFMPGLLLVGPLVVLFLRRLPATRSFRASLMVLAICLHAVVIIDFFRDDPWRVNEWHTGSAIPLAASPLRETPALFLKVSASSYSALTPYFHKESKWVMLGGHLRRDTGSFERNRLTAALATQLPKYVVAPRDVEISDERGQPIADIQRSIGVILAPYGVALAGEDCAVLEIRAQPTGSGRDTRLGTAEGFWFCPAVRVGDIAEPGEGNLVLPSEPQAVFKHFEKACPRFFVPDGGLDVHFDGISRRYYRGTDVRLQILPDGMVSYQYFQSFNFTKVGRGDAILGDKVAIPCARLVGRYRPPWVSN